MLYANGNPVGGGGGTGGHTIIDENGNSMTARAGLQFVGADVSDDATNDKTIVDLASAGGIDGVFIDTDNVIKSATNFRSSLTYTATEDCAFCLYLVTQGNTSAQVRIDGITIIDYWKSSMDTPSFPPIFLKKGQILSIANASASYDSTYRVYGIQTGTSHSKFQPVIYSTEEREIGVWTDGKPLYQKTWQLSTPLTINANSWGTIETLSEQINVIYGIGGYDLGTEYVSYSVGGNCDTSNVLTIYNFRNSQQSYNIITLQYTKTTDVAGSGVWTPSGIPAVHYSTEEQVVGTYFGDTLYQKTIVLSSGIAITDSWTTIYTDALIGNIAQLVDCKYNNVENKGVYGVLNYKPNGNNLQAVYPISGGLSVLAGARFTLQYTKSS